MSARSQFWRTGPKLFINSIPKAGTHLLTKNLDLISGVQSSGLYIRPINVNSKASKEYKNKEFELDTHSFARRCNTVRNGQYFVSHLRYDENLSRFLQSQNIRTIFMVRHPLAVLASNFYYLLLLRRHRKHGFFKGLPDDDARIRYLLEGGDKPFTLGMAEQLETYLGWLSAPHVLQIRFEDLVGQRGGGSDDLKRDVQRRILDFLGLPADALKSDLAAPRSATFRKGQIDSWRELMTPARLAMLSERDLQAIKAYGYEV